MSLTVFTWFVIAACLVYVVAVDANVCLWVVLQLKLFRVWAERQWFRVRYHPDSPWIRYQIQRNAEKLAKEIQAEIETKRNDNL
jgi:hypothetical protein